MELTNTSATIMEFPRLDYIFGWGTGVNISSNPFLIEIRISAIDWLHSTFICEHNPKLEKIEFPILERISLSYDNERHIPEIIRVENNTALKSINLRNIQVAYMNNLIIQRNSALETVHMAYQRDNLERFRVFDINGSVIIEDNESLKELRFGEAGQEDLLKISKRMEIVNNRQLERIFARINENTPMTIRGNPQLSGEILAGLRAVANESSSEFQAIGEPVRNLALLDVCVYVYGQLELAASAEGWTSVRLNRVEGDVFTSDVPIDRLKFLVDTDIYGKFESSLCDFDFSGFRAGMKGSRRGCQTTDGSTASRGIWTTTGGESRTDAVTTATTVTQETVEARETPMTTEESKTTTVTQATRIETSREATETTKETTIDNSTTEGVPSPAGIKITSTAAVTARSFPYLPVIIVSAVLLVLFILLGVVFYVKKRKTKVSKKGLSEMSESSKKSMSSQRGS